MKEADSIDPPKLVANQLNIFIPVGTAIKVAAVKQARVSVPNPIVYIW